jgi:hypothetical protein
LPCGKEHNHGIIYWNVPIRQAFINIRRSRMKKGIVIVVAMFAFLGLTSIAMADNGPETIEINEIQKKMPPVSFKHHEHQKRVEDKCVTCHHTAKEGEAPKACSECHGKVDGAPDFKTAVHKKCQGCHKEQKAAGKNAPVKCTECHKK